MNKCQAGRLGFTGHSGTSGCSERPAPDSVFCTAHHAAALERVAQVPVARRGDKPRRWSGREWMVSGSSTQ